MRFIPPERKAGARPPRWLVERMRRAHPMVSLLYDTQTGYWALVQTKPKPDFLIGLLRDEQGRPAQPNLHNTIRKLDACRWTGVADTGVKQFCEDLERFNKEQRERNLRESHAKIRVGSEMLAWALQKQELKSSSRIVNGIGKGRR